MLDGAQGEQGSHPLPEHHGDEAAGGDGREVREELHRAQYDPGGRVAPVVGRVDGLFGLFRAYFKGRQPHSAASLENSPPVDS